jgi:hypothetical protein
MTHGQSADDLGAFGAGKFQLPQSGQGQVASPSWYLPNADVNC